MNFSWRSAPALLKVTVWVTLLLVTFLVAACEVPRPADQAGGDIEEVDVIETVSTPVSPLASPTPATDLDPTPIAETVDSEANLIGAEVNVEKLDSPSMGGFSPLSSFNDATRNARSRKIINEVKAGETFCLKDVIVGQFCVRNNADAIFTPSWPLEESVIYAIDQNGWAREHNILLSIEDNLEAVAMLGYQPAGYVNITMEADLMTAYPAATPAEDIRALLWAITTAEVQDRVGQNPMESFGESEWITWHLMQQREIKMGVPFVLFADDIVQAHTKPYDEVPDPRLRELGFDELVD